MLYTIISDDRLKFANNPLVKETITDVIKYKKAEIYLIHTFEKAVELHDSVDYFSSKIFDNVFWFEDDINEFIIKYFKSKVENGIVIPLLSTETIRPGLFAYENEKIFSTYDPLTEIFSIVDKNISNYFNTNIIYDSALDYPSVFKLKLKQLGLITNVYSLKSLEAYLFSLFKDNFWKYILLTWSIVYQKTEEFIAEYEYNGEKKNAWLELFNVEDYLNSTKIYGVNTRSVDLDFKKDKDGFYLQYEYSGAENTTGRIFTINLNGHQALQNLPKSDRKVIKAETGCVLIEIDYKGFEFAILSSMLSIPLEDDPHKKMIDNLFPDKNLDRSLGKDINYSIIYGKTIETIARELIEKFPEENYKEIESKLKSQEIFQKASLLTTMLRKYNYKRNRMLLKNYFNRWIKVEKDWALLNNFIQSTGVDFLCLKFNQVTKLLSTVGHKNKILIQNHDSILLQLEDKLIDNSTLFEEILNIMETPFEVIKVQIEYTVGRNWGEMK